MEFVVSSPQILSADPSSSHSSPAPAWGPSHGRQFSTNWSSMSPSHGVQFFTNCSSVGPFNGVQSFRKRLLQRGSPMGSQALPASLLQRGLLSPWVHRSCQEPAPAWALPEVTASFGQPLLQRGVPSTGYSWISAPPWTSMGCRGTACLIMVCSMGCRGISASAPGASPPPPFWCLQSWFSHIVSLLSPAAAFFPF